MLLGKIRITNRLLRVDSEGELGKTIELSNKIYAPTADVFKEDYLEDKELVRDFQIKINLMGVDTVLNIVSYYCDEGYGQLVIDGYLGEEYYGRLPRHYCNLWMPSALEEVQVKDFNEDGVQDILLTVSAISGVGPEAAVSFPTHSVYFQNQEGGFENFYSIDDKIGEIIDSPEKVKDLCGFINFDEDEEGY